jgi:NAD-dependent dihydropyrimidine dehydrogenase PreA subunit
MKEWRGIPREEIPWFPFIDEDKCVGCKSCVEFCPNDVLEFDEGTEKARVIHPYHCTVECRACAKLCPAEAIFFPNEDEFSAFLKEKLARKNA